MKYTSFLLQHAFEYIRFIIRNFSDRTVFFYLKTVLVYMFVIGTTDKSFAEGTKELRPASSDFGYIQIYDRGRIFATYNAPSENRLYVHICTAGEKIFFGFNQPDNDVYFRLKDPSGNIVINAQSIPSSGAGFISTYNQAVAGPSQVVGASGYNAMSYTSLVTGDYYFEFNTGSATTLPTNPSNGNAQRIFDLFDITVADGTIAKPGRLWSYSWDLNSGATNNPLTAKMYILSKDSIVTSVDLNGMQPYGAVITANSTGLSATGNVLIDRPSKVGDYTLPEYKIFLNDPDNVCYPTGSFGNITAPTVVTGCDPANRCINITVNKPGKVEIVLDLNGTAGYQQNTTDRVISADVFAGKNCIPWDSKDGKGNIVTQIIGIPIEVNYLNGVTHLPLYDVEAHVNGYIVALIRPAGPQPSLYWDDSALTAGTVLDTKVNLTGCAAATGCHKWKGRGDNNCSKECPETINTWWYPNIVTDKLTVDLPSAHADADTRNASGAQNDTLVCEHITNFQLSGYVDATAGGSWTGGAGTFSPSRNMLNAVYTPTTTERNNGFVKLYLQSTATGSCPTAIDSLKISFQKAPVVQLAADQTICSRAKTVSVTGSLTNATTGKWTGGNGTFTAAGDINTTYTISTADITAGTINLIYTSTGTRLCAQEDDTINFTFNSPAAVEAGTPITICQGITTVMIHATGDNTSAFLWTGGNGSFQPNNALSTIYTLNQNEMVATKIDLILTAKNGICPDSSDVLTINIAPLPTVDAGKDTLVCKATDFILKGTNSAATSFNWYAIPSQNALSTNSTAEISNVSVTGEYVFKATTADNCSNTDTISIQVYDLPALNPGGPYCYATGLTLQANATITPAVSATYIWSLNNTVLESGAATTSFTVTESGTYTLTYKTDGCSKDVTIIINKPPVLSSPDSLFACAGSAITLTTDASAGINYTWYNANGIAIQNGSTAQVNAGASPVVYYVEATDANSCKNKDSIVAVGTPLPLISVNNATICADSVSTLQPKITNINGSYTNALAFEWKLNTSIVSTNKTFSTSTAGTYTIKVSLGACTASESATVTVHDLPASTLPTGYVFCSDNGNTVTLDAGPDNTYQWLPGKEQTQTIVVHSPGQYDVTIKNQFQCKINASTTVKEICKPSIYVSSAFSPNGDHTNDVYEVFEKHIGTYSMTIFSRWGEVIFYTTDKTVFWDGIYKGEIMPIGVYPYIIKYEGDTEEYKGPYKLEGSVTIIK